MGTRRRRGSCWAPSISCSDIIKAADRQFEQVVALEPQDTLAKNIMNGLEHAPGVAPTTDDRDSERAPPQRV